MTAKPPKPRLADKLGNLILIVLVAPFALLLVSAVFGIDIMAAKPFAIWFTGTLFLCAVWTTIATFWTPHKADWGCALPIGLFAALLGYILLGQLGWR